MPTKLTFNDGGNLVEAIERRISGKKSPLENLFEAAADSILFAASGSLRIDNEGHRQAFEYVRSSVKAQAQIPEDEKKGSPLMQGAIVAFGLMALDPMFEEVYLAAIRELTSVNLNERDYVLSGTEVQFCASKRQIVELVARDFFDEITVWRNDEDGRWRKIHKSPSPSDVEPKDLVCV